MTLTFTHPDTGEHVARLAIIKIDLSQINNVDELHSTLSNALDFPDWYGKNWDAFWDAITTLVEMPSVLEFSGWAAFSSRMPREAEMLQRCLMDLENEYPELSPKLLY